MDNPYQVTLVPELLDTPPRRQSRGVRLLLRFVRAYSVHHFIAVLGFLAMSVDPVERALLFPSKDGLNPILSLICIPLFDLYFLIEPLSDEIAMQPVFVARTRSLTVVSLMVLGCVYLRWPKLTVLVVLGVVSFLVFVSARSLR